MALLAGSLGQSKQSRCTITKQISVIHGRLLMPDNLPIWFITTLRSIAARSQRAKSIWPLIQTDPSVTRIAVK
jgi:hypothetical protein